MGCRTPGSWGGIVAGLLAFGSLGPDAASGQTLEPVEVEGQPLAANVRRLLAALEYLGAPLPAATAAALREGADARDARKLQQLLDPHVLLVVSLGEGGRSAVARGPAPAV